MAGSETDRILRLLDGLAEFTRGGDLRLQTLNLHRILDNLLDLHKNESNWSDIEIVREYDPSIPEFELDPDRITQVFLNLVRNATQAMGGRGRILLRTRVQTQFQIAADDRRPAFMVRVDIDDSGPGIPEADLPHIFAPFFTRREQGTGLGVPAGLPADRVVVMFDAVSVLTGCFQVSGWMLSSCDNSYDAARSVELDGGPVGNGTPTVQRRCSISARSPTKTC